MKTALAGVLAYVFFTGLSFAKAGEALATASAISERFSLSAEALVWWIKDSPAPPALVSTGILGDPGTTVVLGGKEQSTREHPGLRLTAAYRPTERWGLEAGFFYLPSRSASRHASSSGEAGSQDLLIPFFDVTLPGENVTNLSSEERFSGQATKKLTARLLGAELSAVATLASFATGRLELLGGFRHLNLRETLSFNTSSPDLSPGPVEIFQTKDAFDAKNRFYGGQAGVRLRHGRGSWTFDGTAMLALGAMVQAVDIRGALLTNDFNGLGATDAFPGGYFAQPTNMGRHTRTVFAVVPEVKLNVGYEVTSGITVFLGYTFLYAPNMARPGKQIDREINPNQNPSFTGVTPSPLVGPVSPRFRFRDSAFWAQGINLGLMYRF